MASTDAKRNNRTDDRQVSRADEARQHTAEMAALHADEIARSIAETQVVEGMPALRSEGRVPKVSVVDQDSVSAVLDRGRGIASRCDLAVLDFASFTSPGGGFIRGAMAQEEALCAESFLYNVLSQKKAFFDENRRRNINCDLYRNRALIVPKMRFEREGYHSYADVLVVAAPNARLARANYHLASETIDAAIKDRVRFVLALASGLGHGRLVAGAFGCGVFGCNAAIVAEAFRAELASGAYALDEVVFAVPRGRADENLEIFEHVFATFPEANAAPYETRAQRAKAKASEEARRAADGDDEVEDDDWRQYL